MKAFAKTRRAAGAALGATLLAAAGIANAQLAPEPIPNVLTLPEQYPDTWVFAFDTNFTSLVDGRVVILDVAAQSRNYKGQIGAAQFATFVQSVVRPELYVAETFFSRGHRGKMVDVVTIYNKATLEVEGEILLPGKKRAQSVTHKNGLQLVDNDRFLLVYNFTPTTSVTVVDMVERRIVGEVPIAGCGLIYPVNQRGFSSMCSDGSMLVSHLDEKGILKSQVRIDPFFDADNDPLFAKPAVINGIAYFPSYGGRVQPIDMRGDVPIAETSWQVAGAAEQDQNWRVAGWQIATGHPDGRLFLLVHKDGHKGTHKDGGSEVWVYDAVAGERLKRIQLKTWGVSIEVTNGADPYLVVTNANMDIDVYDADSGEHQRMIGDGAAQTPFSLFAVE